MLFAYERPLCADSVEKVENIAATKFTQKRADRRIRLRCLVKHLRRPLVEFAPVEAVPHVPKRQAHQRFLENWSRRRIGLFQQNLPIADFAQIPTCLIADVNMLAMTRIELYHHLIEAGARFRQSS